MPKGIYQHKKGYKRPPYSEEWKKNISLALKGKPKPWQIGRPLSEEHKRKISEANKGHPNYLLKQTKEARRKIGEANKGEKHYSWKGGAKRPYIHTGWRYYKWRSEVYERDNWTCQTCGKRSGIGEPVYLEAHHIKGWSKYPELRYEVYNGVTLCKECHRLTRKKHF